MLPTASRSNTNLLCALVFRSAPFSCRGDMPSRRRRPKSRKSKSSRRKPPPRRALRGASSSALSSDYEACLTSSADEEEETEDDQGESLEDDEDDEDFANTDGRNAPKRAAGRHTRQRPRRRSRLNTSDEDFDMDLEKDSDDDVSADDGRCNPSAAFALNARNSVGNRHAQVAAVQPASRTHASGRSKVRRQKRRKQNSSDEDFDIALENGSGLAEDVVPIRPVTRAMEGGQPLESWTEGRASLVVQNKNANEDADAGPDSNRGAGEPTLPRNSAAGKRAKIVEKRTTSSTRKGKEKVSEGVEPPADLIAENVAGSSAEHGVAAAVVCGICLNETLVVDRGKLDCCDHFFCFGCIMEWAKVESRCPMCKQRFATVVKAGSGVSKRTRTIRIPLRDQVYVPPEDDLPFEDPYADVACMECHGTEDEGLLLLCDRCDSAAHTFCVGLGRSVPRGDWYCRDCQALASENSDSESQAEELFLASETEEENEGTLLRSIVSSDSPRRRQRRVRRMVVPTTGPSSHPRRISQGERRRLWRRLVSNRGRRRRVALTPQLSQSARAYLSNSTPETNPVSSPSVTSQSGSARTVPQQRRLQERIVALRNNWGRLQNGDVQFDALRTERATSGNPRESSNRTSASTSAPVSCENNVAEVDFAKTLSQDEKELEQAWRMMGQARDLSSKTSNGVPPKKAVSCSNAFAPSLSLQRSSQPAEHSVDKAIWSPSISSGNADHLDTPSHPSAGRDVGFKAESKDSLEVLLRRAKGMMRSPVIGAKNGSDMKQDLHSSNYVSTHSDLGMSSCGMLQSTRGNVVTDFPVTSSNQVDAVKSQIGTAGMHSCGQTSDHKGHGTSKENVNSTKTSFSPPANEGLKIHLTELVKKQTWPVYLAERLDKEQFKRIARAAVHSLLALFDTSNHTRSFACSHHEEQGENPFVPCCTKCLNQQVEIAVTSAKNKVVLL